MHSLWNLGFRPFFLLAGVSAGIWILLWILLLGGWIAPLGYLDPMIWHAHEMIYGFTTAVIAGFILTASQNWTGIRGVHGNRLKFLVAVWLSARIALLVFPTPTLIAVLLDLSFYPLLAFFLFPYLKDPDLKIERIFYFYFAMFLGGNLLVHLEALGILSSVSLKGVMLGLHASILMVLFMGGRVIPFFTESSVAKAQPKTYPWVEKSAHLVAWSFAMAWVIEPLSPASATLGFLTAGIHFIRLLGWQVKRVRKIPLVWVLHLAYLWIVLGFFLSGFYSLGLIALGPAVHALTVGGLGGITYGMMTRVALGHTGRRLHPHFWTVVGYGLLNLAAVVRVVIPVFFETWLSLAIQLSGALWILSFVIFIWIYFPILTRPRVDGRPG